jgi:polyisoprenoid-binding protein YceI
VPAARTCVSIAAALLAAGACGASAQSLASAHGDTLRLAADSRLDVRVAKAGVLAVAGHEHVVRARDFSGFVVYRPDEPDSSSVLISVATDGLYVVPAADSADIPKITAAMRRQVLRTESYPEIRFVSSSVVPIPAGVHVEGTLTMVGRARPVAFDAALRVGTDTLEGTATFSVRQTDFGIRPYRTALGLVRVADEVRFEIRLRAVRR